MFLTIGQIKKICSKNKYILLRHKSGKLIGYNCNIFPLAKKKWRTHGNQKTVYTSYITCEINEYITYKVGFLNT